MKKTFRIIIIFLLSTIYCFGQSEYRKIDHDAFTRGEKLTYRVYYEALLTGKLVAGKATLEITDENEQINGRNTCHVVGIGKTSSFFNWFFKVVDRYETYFDEEAIVPMKFVRRVNEGGYKISQDVDFDPVNNIATSNTATVEVPPNVQDLISSFYFARTIDLTNVQIGDEYPLQFFLDDSVFTTKIIYTGKEVVKAKSGTFRCLKFKPMVLTGEVFNEPYPITLWISDDKNRIPVLVESAVIVGSVKMDLTHYSGLRNPMTSKLE